MERVKGRGSPKPGSDIISLTLTCFGSHRVARRFVAIKNKAGRRVKREAAMLQRLPHDNVCRCHDYHIWEDG